MEETERMFEIFLGPPGKLNSVTTVVKNEIEVGKTKTKEKT